MYSHLAVSETLGIELAKGPFRRRVPGQAFKKMRSLQNLTGELLRHHVLHKAGVMLA